MPIVGIDMDSDIIFDNFSGMHSKTIEKAPAFSKILASSINFFAIFFVFPLNFESSKHIYRLRG